MKFAVAHEPLPDKTPYVRIVALVYAVFLVILVVSQLYSFEEFLLLVKSFGLPGGDAFAHVLSAIIVTVEVLALPFLLRMRLSYAMRIFSMLCGWLVASIWAGLNIWFAFSNDAVTNIGYFGDVISIAFGVMSVGIAIDLIGLTIWASWGMWPLRRTK